MAADSSDACCKIGRATAKYDLRTLDEDLRRRHEAGDSLRDLESTVNERILDGAIRAAGADVVSRVESLYEQLTGTDASAGEVADLRTKLEQEGVDVDAVESEFVSYQTVRHHLKKCLDRDTSRESRTTPAQAIGTIDWAQARSEAVIGRTLSQLARTDDLAIEDLDVMQSTKVTCGDCGQTYGVTELVDAGGCSCRLGED